MLHNQTTFLGGMNQLASSIGLGDDEYYLLINARVRDGLVRPVTKPVPIRSFPVGVYQGIYGFEDEITVFVSGNAYVSNINTAPGVFNRIKDLRLSESVDVLYATYVSAASLQYKRVADTADDASSTISLASGRHSTPRALVVQDGVGQPSIILPDGTVRRSQTYHEWTTDVREYVPIGRQMCYNDGILYVVSPEGSTLYRSVQGRPLDFVVAIDTSGDKVAKTEQEGGANVVSHRVDFDMITCVSTLNINDGSIFVGTRRYGYIVTPNYDTVVFGQPTFNNTRILDTGVINHFSIVEMLGDDAIIDRNGIRSFNAVAQIRNQGQNAPFSAKINNIFSDIIQNQTCAVSFDNYALFGVNTRFGQAILVYDTLINQWVGIDIFDIGAIKQFAVAACDNRYHLYCITYNNQAYELYTPGGDTATARFVSREWSEFTDVVTLREFMAAFHNIKSSGTVTCNVYIDKKFSHTVTFDVSSGATNSSLSLHPYYGLEEDATLLHSDEQQSLQGLKASIEVIWNFDGELIGIFGRTQREKFTTLKQFSKRFKSVVTSIKGIL